MSIDPCGSYAASLGPVSIPSINAHTSSPTLKLFSNYHEAPYRCDEDAPQNAHCDRHLQVQKGANLSSNKSSRSSNSVDFHGYSEEQRGSVIEIQKDYEQANHNTHCKPCHKDDPFGLGTHTGIKSRHQTYWQKRETADEDCKCDLCNKASEARMCSASRVIVAEIIMTSKAFARSERYAWKVFLAESFLEFKILVPSRQQPLHDEFSCRLA